MSALQQLALYEPTDPAIPMPRTRAPHPVSRVCAGCREKEARYGFRDARRHENSRTLCFECFRMELDRRHSVAERLARSSAGRPRSSWRRCWRMPRAVDAVRRSRRATRSASGRVGRLRPRQGVDGGAMVDNRRVLTRRTRVITAALEMRSTTSTR